jgi:hypothetical protein
MITIADHVLINTQDGARTETKLESDEDVLATYELHFGMPLDRVPVPVADP